MSLVHKDFEEFRKCQLPNEDLMCGPHIINLLNIGEELSKDIYNLQVQYNNDMDINLDMEKNIRKIVNEEFEKIFLKNSDLINSNRFLKATCPIEKDSKAFDKLLELRKRTPKKLPTKKAYIKWIKEE